MLEQSTTWKRDLSIGITLIGLIMAFSFGYYASLKSHKHHCEQWFNSLEQRKNDPLQMLDYYEYTKEMADFRTQCNQ